MLGNYAKEQECHQKVLASRHATDADKALARKLTASLGKVYYEQKQYAECIAAFEETLTVCAKDDPYRSHVLLWLGYSCHATGEHARARNYFQAVLASPYASEAEKSSARKGLGLLPSSDF
jgi:tetratricopeptide (TPR) repeat protein